MGDNVLKLTTELSTKGVEKGFEAIRKGTVSTAQAVNKAIDGIKSAVKKVISLVALKKIFDQFKQYLDSSLKKNREYASSMKALRGSVAAAFQPIYEIAAPAIIYLVNLLNMVVQAIGRFIAALSGKSYAQMLKNAQALSKQKDLLSGVGGAAKDAARQLMSFDEINRLEDNSGSGSGMTFSEADLGSATGAIDDFAEKLRELFQSGQFEQAGDLIAQTVNKMLDAFDAEKLGATVGTWVQNFADFLNGLLFGIEWDKIGAALADGINGLLSKVSGTTIGEILRLKFTVAIGMFAGFIKKFDGSQAGQFLGDAFLGFAQGLGNDLAKNFDSEFWEKLNQNISDGFAAFVPRFIAALKVAVDTVIQQAPAVIETLGNLGYQIVDAISSALSSMDEEIQMFDDRGFQLNATQTRWEALGASVAEGFRKIDWEGIFSSGIDAVGKLTNGLIEFLSSAISGIGDKWTEIGSGIADGFKEIHWGECFSNAGQVFLGLANAIIDGLSALIAGFSTDDMKNFINSVAEAMKDLPWEDTILSAVRLAKVSGNFYVKLLTALLDAATGADTSALVNQSMANSEVTEQFKQMGKSDSEAIVAAYESGQLAVIEDGFGNKYADAWNSVILESSDYFDEVEAAWEKKGFFGKLLSGFKSPVQVDDSGNRFMYIPDGTDNGTGGGMIVEAKEQAQAVGDAIVDGVVDAIGDREDDAYQSGAKIIGSMDGTNRSGIIGGMADAGDIHSPSKIAEDIGINLIDGLFVGLDTFESKMNNFIMKFSAKLKNLADVAVNVSDETALMLDGLSGCSEGMSSQVSIALAAASASIAAFRNNAITDLNAVGEAMVTLTTKASSLSGLRLGSLGTSIRHSTAPSWNVDFSNLYHAADGAVIPPNREFMAVFGDQRSGTNIEAPESLIRQIVREESGSNGNSGRLESLLEELIGTVGSIRIGDDTIGRAANRYSRAHGRAIGV